MGRRSDDTEGDRPRLAEYDPGNILKLAPDLIDKRLARQNMRLAAGLPLGHQSLDARRGRPDQPFRALVEPTLPRLPGLIPGTRNRLIVVRSGAETAVDQPKRVANARQPRHGLRIGFGPGLGFVLRNQVKHASGVSGQG